MKDFKEKKSKPPTVSPAKWKKIRRRAGELALNHGKHAIDPGEREIRRAKRELQGLRIKSPKP